MENIFNIATPVTIKQVSISVGANNTYSVTIVSKGSGINDIYTETFNGLTYEQCNFVQNNLKVGYVYQKIAGYAK